MTANVYSVSVVISYGNRSVLKSTDYPWPKGHKQTNAYFVVCRGCEHEFADPMHLCETARMIAIDRLGDACPSCDDLLDGVNEYTYEVDDGNDEGEEQEQEDDDQLAQILGSSNLPEAS